MQEDNTAFLKEFFLEISLYHPKLLYFTDIISR